MSDGSKSTRLFGPASACDLSDGAAEVEQPGVAVVGLLIGQAEEQCQDDAARDEQSRPSVCVSTP